MKQPIFDLDEIIDISYKFGGLPNRIKIISIYANNRDIGWRYRVLMENTGTTTDLSETFINERRCNSELPIYNNPTIIKRYNDGWRFCGNFAKQVANNNGSVFAESCNIAGVKLFPALSPSGKLLKDKYGVWIKYVNTIHSDGRISDTNNGITIK